MIKKLYKICTYTILFSLLLSLTGCWDVEEVNLRGTANAIYFDVGMNSDTKMGASFHVPGSIIPPVGTTDQQFEQRYFTLSGEGDGALDSWRNIQTNATRNLYFGQINAIVISEKFASNRDLNNSLEFIGRMRNVNSNAYLMVTKDDPQELFDLETNNNYLFGTYVNQFFTSPAKRMLAIPVTLWQVFRIIDGKTADVFLPMIKISQEQYQITGTALFSRNTMVGELDMYETGILALLRDVKDGYYTVPLSGGGLLSVTNFAGKCKITPRYDSEGKLIIDVKMKITGRIAETIPHKKEVTVADQKRYEDAVKVLVTSEISKLLTKLQQLNSDPVDFGGELKIKYPEIWEQVDWYQLYPTARFNVTTEVDLKTSGVFR